VTGRVGLSTTEVYLHSQTITQLCTSTKGYTVEVAQECSFFLTVGKYKNTETNVNT